MINRVESINFDWKLKQGFSEDYLSPGFDAKDFDDVNIPHTTKEVPFNNFDEKIYQMESSYRKSFFVDKLEENQQVYINFDGVMTYAKVYINGKFVGEHKGGYTPFRFNITYSIIDNSENILFVYVDSTKRKDIPPFGSVIDYLTYGGIYREVQLEYTSNIHVETALIKPSDVSEDKAQLNVDLYMVNIPKQTVDIDFKFNLFFRNKLVHSFSKASGLGNEENEMVTLSEAVNNILLWDVDEPNLYNLQIVTSAGGKTVDDKTYRFGFRDIKLTEHGFYLNGRKLKIQGLNRHQSYPYAGYAMPRSAQYKDAEILKHDLGLNAVRLSHYPQSKHFMDRCDELGLLVFDELPGWQHIGDKDWQEVALKNVEEMIKKDCNHPSVFIWGVRINESQDNDSFYEQTNKKAHDLDSTRPTGGVRCIMNSSLLEDVYTYNDFSHTGNNAGLLPKKDVTKTQKPYLITEYNGHMYPTKKYDDELHRVNQLSRHLNVIEAIQKDNFIAGGFGWCMFDYNTHKDFGSGDKICYHGVLDMFRIPKHAAYAYASQQDEKPVMHIASTFDIGEYAGSLIKDVYVLTNCDYIKFYKNGKYVKTYYPRTDIYPNLKHPPMIIDDYIGDEIEKNEKFTKKDAKVVKRLLTQVSKHGQNLSLINKLAMARIFIKYKMNSLDAEDLYTKYFGGWGGEATTYKFEGYIDDECVLETTKSQVFNPRPDVKIDSRELYEKETYDTARVVIRLLDDHGNEIHYANDAFNITVEGPIDVIGPKTISLVGGSTGFWIKSIGKKGEAKLIIRSERFGEIIQHITVNKD